MEKISAVLIVLNEETKLEACLRALDWVHEIIVVDGGSADATTEIARRFTSKVHSRDFDNFANQKNFAIRQASGDWIFSVDADEIVSPALRKAMLEIAEKGSPCDGFMLTRKNFIFGKELRYGGQGPEKVLRLFRKEKGRFDQPIHEKVKLDGILGEIEGDLIHHSLSSLSDYFRKLDLYTRFEAEWFLKRGVRPSGLELYVKPMMRFCYYYVIRLGLLDGYEGFLFHSLSSYYYFLKYAKLKEMLEGKTNGGRRLPEEQLR